jgi:hypothetical protein
LQGIMADGRSLIVPVYRVRGINIGGSCRLDEVEVAVFPGGSRSLLGLSALRKTAPFMFSMEPPELQMSNCGDTVLRQEARRVEGEKKAASASMSAVSTAEKPDY